MILIGMFRIGRFLLLLATCLSFCWAGIAAASSVHAAPVAKSHNCGDHAAGREKQTKAQCCKYDCCLTKIVPIAAPRPVTNASVYTYDDAPEIHIAASMPKVLFKPPRAG